MEVPYTTAHAVRWRFVRECTHLPHCKSFGFSAPLHLSQYQHRAVLATEVPRTRLLLRLLLDQSDSKIEFGSGFQNNSMFYGACANSARMVVLVVLLATCKA